MRVDRSELAQIVFEHVCTVQDELVLADAVADGLHVRRAGTTEWKAHRGDRVISLAWDWLEANDGALCPLRLVPPRTNLRLLEDRGYDMEFVREEAELWQAISNLPWSGPAHQGLARELGASPPAFDVHGMPTVAGSRARH